MKIRAFAVLAVILLTQGCYRYAVKIGHGGDTTRPPTKSEWAHHFIAGAAGETSVDVSAVCSGSNDATIKIERNMVDAILGNVVGNVLWQPSTVEVYCGNGATAEMTLDEKNATRLAQSEAFADVVAEVEPDALPAVLAFQGR